MRVLIQLVCVLDVPQSLGESHAARADLSTTSACTVSVESGLQRRRMAANSACAVSSSLDGTPARVLSVCLSASRMTLTSYLL